MGDRTSKPSTQHTHTHTHTRKYVTDAVAVDVRPDPVRILRTIHHRTCRKGSGESHKMREKELEQGSENER